MRAAAARHGREVRFSLSLRPILAPTEDAAWATRGTDQATDRRIACQGRPRSARAGRTRGRAGCWPRPQGERLDKRLWTGAALLTGARGNTTSLVGTPLQVAEALCDYYDLGVTTFLIRGFDPLNDAIEYGRSLLPLTRELIAERDADCGGIADAVARQGSAPRVAARLGFPHVSITVPSARRRASCWRRSRIGGSRLEAQPSRFMRAVLPDALRHAASRLGAFIGADGKDIAFVDNATTGCNAVLRSLRLQPGDEIVVLTHGYGAVRNTVRYVASKPARAWWKPQCRSRIRHADAIVANIAAALTQRTRLAVVDHITSGSALVLPLQRIIAACRDAGVPVLVDGAHGPAQVPLDMRALGADWYTGNCHKWLCAPKGSAFLYAAPNRQQDLHPVTISHGFGNGYLAEFDWTGTRDPSAYLATDVAIDFHARLGGDCADGTQYRAGRGRHFAAGATAEHRTWRYRRAGWLDGRGAASVDRNRNGGTFGGTARAAAGGRHGRADARAGWQYLATDFRRGLQ